MIRQRPRQLHTQVHSDGGRACPLSYRTGAAALANTASDVTLASDAALFIVGGLYGNVEALLAVEERLAADTAPARCVFNGDFNFFNSASVDFDKASAMRGCAHIG